MAADMERERIVADHIAKHLTEWQAKGWVPDMRIEVGGPPRYQGQDLVRARGWTHWHHLFNPRQLLVLGLANRTKSPLTCLLITRYSNYLAKLCAWETTPARVNAEGKQIGGASNNAKQVFTNQALNTLFNYGCRSSRDLEWDVDLKSFPLPNGHLLVTSHPAKRSRGRQRHLHHGSPLWRRSEVRGDSRFLHRLATQEPAAGVRRTGSGTAAGRSPSRVRTRTFVAEWWPPTSG